MKRRISPSASRGWCPARMTSVTAMAPALMNGLRGMPCSYSSCTTELNAAARRLAADALPQPVADLAERQRQREDLRDALDRERHIAVAARRDVAGGIDDARGRTHWGRRAPAQGCSSPPRRDPASAASRRRSRLRLSRAWTGGALSSVGRRAACARHGQHERAPAAAGALGRAVFGGKCRTGATSLGDNAPARLSAEICTSELRRRDVAVVRIARPRHPLDAGNRDLNEARVARNPEVARRVPR